MIWTMRLVTTCMSFFCQINAVFQLQRKGNILSHKLIFNKINNSNTSYESLSKIRSTLRTLIHTKKSKKTIQCQNTQECKLNLHHMSLLECMDRQDNHSLHKLRWSHQIWMHCPCPLCTPTVTQYTHTSNVKVKFTILH